LIPGNSRWLRASHQLWNKKDVSHRRGTRRKRAGAILVDALIGLFIVAMGAIAYYAVLPVVHRSHEIAQQESKAAQIASRVTEQFGMLRPSDISYSTLSALGVVDSGQSAQPWTFSHIPMDDGTDYSPAKVLRNGSGTITTSTIANGSVVVTVQITWTSPTGKARSFTTGTIVGGYR
jgi:Tfp pilus assembly protein PilV